MHAVHRGWENSELVDYTLQAAKVHNARVITELIILLDSRVDGSVITIPFWNCFPGTAHHPPLFITSRVKYASLIY